MTMTRTLRFEYVVSGFSREYVVSGFSRTVGVALFFLTVGAQVTTAQSLGDVANREAERRKETASGRVYTNGDLAPVDAPAPSPAPVPIQAAPAPTPGTPATTPAAKPADKPGVEPSFAAAPEKRDEQYWRAMAKDLRGRLAKTTADIAATQARIAEIDAGPQTPTLAREREVISTSLTRLQQLVRSRSEELARFVRRTTNDKIPEEWTR